MNRTGAIVDVVFRIAPDRGEGRRTGGAGFAGDHAFLLAQPDEVDETLDLDQLIGCSALIFSIRV